MYNASRFGYDAVVLFIEDFNSNRHALSAIPIQFLIYIVETVPDNNYIEAPIYIA